MSQEGGEFAGLWSLIDAAARLAQLRADTGRKLPDCCVLLAAQEHDGAVASFDADLLRAAQKLELEVI